ncbi:MAG: hypothetical protein ACJ762_18540 [Solirubrobacteraceae bacterium]
MDARATYPSHMSLARRGLIALAAAGGLALPGTASAAVTCNLAANTLTVNVTGTGDQPVALKMISGGTEVGVFTDLNATAQQACNMVVPASTTTAIQVTDTEPGDLQRTLVKVSLAGGPFLNSDATGEGAGDKEIEIGIDAGAETNDDLLVAPGPGSANDNWRMGNLDGNVQGAKGFNLNDAETGSVDVDDIVATDLEAMQLIDTNDGNDIMDARGGSGFVGPMTMLSGTMQLVAGNGDDQIYAGNGDGWRVEGDLGADTMIGGPGNDFIQASFGTDNDIIDGNGGVDSCSFLNHGPAVTVDLGITGPQDTIGAGTDTFSDCENLSGGDGDDTLTGDAGANAIFGGAGNDTLRPGPGSANDTLDGGAGTQDTADYSLATPFGVTISLATAGAQATGGYGSDTISNTENLVGTLYADTLTGNASVNRITGGGGADVLSLGDNDDVFDVFDALGDTVDCGNGTDSGLADEPGTDALDANCETPDFAPSTVVASGPDNGLLTSTTTQMWGLITSEAGGVFEYSVDNAAFVSCPASCQIPALSDGAHTVRFRAVEPAAPSRADPTPAQRTLTVDTTAPGVTIDSGPTGTTTEPSPTFGFSSPDSGATLACSVDSAAFGPCSGATTHKTATLSVGAHVFEVRATDAAGNSAKASRAFTVVEAPDTTAPDTTASAATVLKRTATISFSSTEPGSSFLCRLDGGAYAACTSPGTFSNLTHGSHTVDVVAVDAAGNPDASPASVTFAVDAKAPNTKLRKVSVRGTTATIRFSSTEKGSTFSCRLDARKARACRSGQRYRGLARGKHRVRVWAIDKAGNKDPTPAKRTFRVG